MSSTYIITLTYTGELFTAIDKFILSLPPTSRITSSWSKRDRTLTATIADIQPEDISFLKLKFQLEANSV